LRPDARCNDGDPGNCHEEFFPAGDYRHAPAGVVQLRVIRGGSSYAEIDLGSGLRRVFTRPGDLLRSLPGPAMRFKIEEPRELTMITMGVAAYHHVASRTVERRCGHYSRPWRRKSVLSLWPRPASWIDDKLADISAEELLLAGDQGCRPSPHIRAKIDVA
jgi:hypothetical protein